MPVSAALADIYRAWKGRKPRRRGRRPLSSRCLGGAGFSDCRAFTLLEVMIALAIMAIALTSLFGSQSQSLSLAIEAKFNTTASMLAQEKLAEYEAGIMDLAAGEGDFGEQFPGFAWKAEVNDADLELFSDLEEPENSLVRLDLTISWEEEPGLTASLTEYVRRREPL